MILLDRYQEGKELQERREGQLDANEDGKERR